MLVLLNNDQFQVFCQIQRLTTITETPFINVHSLAQWVVFYVVHPIERRECHLLTLQLCFCLHIYSLEEKFGAMTLEIIFFYWFLSQKRDCACAETSARSTTGQTPSSSTAVRYLRCSVSAARPSSRRTRLPCSEDRPRTWACTFRRRRCLVTCLLLAFRLPWVSETERGSNFQRVTSKIL